MSAWAAIGSAVSSLAGPALSYFSQEETNDTNTQIARENTSFQERMSNTAYQRSMDDMETAGLNPILAYKSGGASTPSGTTIQEQNPAAAFGSFNAYDAYTKALDAKAIKAATNKTIEETKVAKANQKILRETWIKNQMYNKNVLPTELASAKTGFHLNYLKNKNDTATAAYINKYKPSILDKAGKATDSFINTFRSNFNKSYDHYFNQPTTPTTPSGSSGSWSTPSNSSKGASGSW